VDSFAIRSTSRARSALICSLIVRPVSALQSLHGSDAAIAAKLTHAQAARPKNNDVSALATVACIAALSRLCQLADTRLAKVRDVSLGAGPDRRSRAVSNLSIYRIVSKSSEACVGSDGAVEVMRFILYPGIEAIWVSHTQLAVAHEPYDRASAAGAAIRIGLRRHICVPDASNRIISSNRRGGKNNPDQSGDKKSHPRHRLHPN
jgi:hypothetical protein